jgi:hypothetical protein
VKGKYRIYVLDAVPANLKERISEIHAFAILNSGKEGSPVYTQNVINALKERTAPKMVHRAHP